MPIRKLRLSKLEQAEYRASAQRLLARGLISRIPKWLEIPPALDIHIDPMACELAELPYGETCYAVWVELIAKQKGLILEDCRISTSFDDQIVLGSDEVNWYCSPAGPFYSVEGALNGRIERALRFRGRGDLVRGTLVFWGLRRIPDTYGTGALVPFQLGFTNSLGEDVTTDGTLRVSRRRPMREMQGPKQSLFADPWTPYESVGQQQQRAYRRTLTEEGVNPYALDPERIRELHKQRYAEMWIEVAKKSSSAADQIAERKEGRSAWESENASAQEQPPVDRE